LLLDDIGRRGGIDTFVPRQADAHLAGERV
jgi:hypothetical protein